MSTIKLKRSDTRGKKPLPEDLEYGELALNTGDGSIFMKVTSQDDPLEISARSLEVSTGNASNVLSRSYMNDGPQPFGVTLQVGVGGILDGAIAQDATYDPLTRKWFSSYDAGANGRYLVRHNFDGSYEITSANLSEHMGHGQGLGRIYPGVGAAKLMFERADRKGITIADPMDTNGGSISNVQSIRLVSDEYGAVWPSVSLNGRFLVIGTNRLGAGLPPLVRIYSIDKLLENTTGDASDDYLIEFYLTSVDEYSGPNVVQGVALDGDVVYVLTGGSGQSVDKYLSAFTLSGERLWRSLIFTGKEFANSRHTTTYELEGLEWILSPFGKPSLWTSVVVRREGGVGYDNIAMPLYLDAVSTGRNPASLSLFSTEEHEISVPSGQRISFSHYNGPSQPFTERMSIRGDGRILFGAEENLEPSSTTVMGINLKPDLGRVVGSAQAVAGQWQSLSGTSQLHQFYSGNALVGNISVTPSGTSFNQTSDSKFKKSKGELSSEKAFEILNLITVHNFTWDETYSNEESVGVFAQELYEVYPAAVTKGGWFLENGEPSEEGVEGAIYTPWSVDYSKLIPVMIKAIQGLILNSFSSDS